MVDERPADGLSDPGPGPVPQGPRRWPAHDLARQALPALGPRTLLHRAPPGQASQEQRLLPVHTAAAPRCIRRAAGRDLNRAGPGVGAGPGRGGGAGWCRGAAGLRRNRRLDADCGLAILMRPRHTAPSLCARVLPGHTVEGDAALRGLPLPCQLRPREPGRSPWACPRTGPPPAEAGPTTARRPAPSPLSRSPWCP